MWQLDRRDGAAGTDGGSSPARLGWARLGGGVLGSGAGCRTRRPRPAPVPADPPAPFSLAARAWCQVAQKFTGGIGNKLCGKGRGAPAARGGGEAARPRSAGGRPRALPRGGGAGGPGAGAADAEAVCPCRCQALLYGDAEKPVETGAKAAPGGAEPRPACTCDKKPCGCQKAEVNYAFLHSTGNGAPGPRRTSPICKKNPAVRSGHCRGGGRPGGAEGARGRRLRGAARPQPQPAPAPPRHHGRWAFLRPAKKKKTQTPDKKRSWVKKKKALKSRRAAACRLL